MLSIIVDPAPTITNPGSPGLFRADNYQAPVCAGPLERSWPLNATTSTFVNVSMRQRQRIECDNSICLARARRLNCQSLRAQLLPAPPGTRVQLTSNGSTNKISYRELNVSDLVPVT